jgi:hypothetical protein
VIPAELTEVDDRDQDRLLVLSAWVCLPARLARPKAIPWAARIDYGQRREAAASSAESPVTRTSAFPATAPRPIHARDGRPVTL